MKRVIREAKVEDAPAFVALFDAVNSETTFMLFDRGESPRSVEQQSWIFEEPSQGLCSFAKRTKNSLSLLQAVAVSAAARPPSISLWASCTRGWVVA
jgi:hypothetical protein